MIFIVLAKRIHECDICHNVCVLIILRMLSLVYPCLKYQLYPPRDLQRDVATLCKGHYESPSAGFNSLNCILKLLNLYGVVVMKLWVSLTMEFSLLLLLT